VGKKSRFEVSMKLFLAACVLALVLFSATPAQEAPQGFEYWSVPSLQHTAEALRKKAKSSPDHSASERLADFSNELFMMAHREADGAPEWHETQADIFVIESGTATLVVGGNLVGAEEVAPHEKRNGKIEGGTSVALVPGDVVRIPAKTPHQLLLNGSGGLNYFVVKVKNY
jgi:mannose-6-phosphate isomerase-like protein (cupin superfamily)